MEHRKRKHIRLRDYDYSQAGIYFVTICTKNRRCILSKVVGRGLAPAVPQLTDCGRMVEEELFALAGRYPTVFIERYIVMPNHFHGLIGLRESAAGASPRPTLMQILGAFKSLTTRRWNEMTGQAGEKLWQPGYYEHVLRDDNDFLSHWLYIEHNPEQWAKDEYYQEE